MPAIERLAADALTVTLAVSLHAANDVDRSHSFRSTSTTPSRASRRRATWRETTGRRVSFEWALIDARERHGAGRRRARGDRAALRAHVNLIALNPTPGYAGGARRAAGSPRSARRSRGLGVTATIRATRGRAIDAACGQLAAVAGGRVGRRCARGARSRARTDVAGRTRRWSVRRRARPGASEAVNLGRRSASSTAPTTHPRPPETAEIVGVESAATAPASKLPSLGPPVTTAIWIDDSLERYSSAIEVCRIVLRSTAEMTSAHPATARQHERDPQRRRDAERRRSRAPQTTTATTTARPRRREPARPTPS